MPSAAVNSLVLQVNPERTILHTVECPHLNTDAVAALVPATDEQRDQLPVCASCRGILDGGRRRSFASLEDAMEVYKAPLENRPRMREIAGALTYSRIWVNATGSYIALAGAAGVVAYFGKGYVDLHLPQGGFETEWLPRHGTIGARGDASAPAPKVAVCPTCNLGLPGTGRCDTCDA